MLDSSDGRAVAPVPVVNPTPSDEIHRLEAELAEAQQQVANLQVALQTSREIGTAIGVVMSQHKITSDAAFELLRQTSQNTHRKLREVAAEVVYTGSLIV